MKKANRRGNPIVKLFLLIPLVMAAISLNADHLSVLTIGGEKHYFGKDYPLTQHYSCGAVATYDPDKTIDDDGVFDVEFTKDARIVVSLPAGDRIGRKIAIIISNKHVKAKNATQDENKDCDSEWKARYGKFVCSV